jgi:uncharacterized protein
MRAAWGDRSCTVSAFRLDGVPEPLRFVPSDGIHLMLVPAGGFGWVIGNHEVAPRGQSECVVSLGARTDADVNELVERTHRAGAEIVTEPAQQPWGYAGTFADPDGRLRMVTSA